MENVLLTWETQARCSNILSSYSYCRKVHNLPSRAARLGFSSPAALA